jgi:hypothetical protein
MNIINMSRAATLSLLMYAQNRERLKLSETRRESSMEDYRHSMPLRQSKSIFQSSWMIIRLAVGSSGLLLLNRTFGTPPSG